jgi:hypothetical protein
VGSYDTYAIPRRGYVTKIERQDRGLRLSVDIEIVMKFMRDYQILRQPMRLVDATVRKRAAPECRYVVVEADGRIALIGVSLPREDLTFVVELDGRLPAGQYTVMAEILVNGNAIEFGDPHPGGDWPEAVKLGRLIGDVAAGSCPDDDGQLRDAQCTGRGMRMMSRL